MRHFFHSARLKRFMRKPLISIVATGSILFFYPLHAFATPSDGLVVKGVATISQSGLSTTINQATARAVIDWRGFDIGANERVQFIQASQSAIALNRITGGNPTSILGQLAANGRVFISNPNGIVFGAGAQVDVAGLMATTMSMNADDFMSGKMAFNQGIANASSYVVNQGEIRIADNGFCFLVAPAVQNSGTIVAQLGKVVMASGDSMTIDFNGDGLTTYTISGKALDNILGPDGKPFTAAVSNSGSVKAPGGDIVMVGNTASNNIFASVVNNSGMLEATSLVSKGGSVTLNAGDGDAVITGSINVSGTGTGQVGGSVEILGNRVGLFGNAAIDASGTAGGGTVLVGGDLHGQGGVPTASQTVVSSGASIKANATDVGNGGKVVVWADNSTSFNGSIEARGGAAGGNGGFVETSGKQTLAFNGNVDTRAPQGLTGTLLLDPTNITISTSGDTGTMVQYLAGTFTDPATSPSNLNTTTLQIQLGCTSVIVDTASSLVGPNGWIEVMTPILDWSNSNSLTLKAKSNITIDSGATITNSSSGVVNFYADGAVALNAAVSLSGGAFTVAGYSGSGSAASFTANSSGSINTFGGSVNIASGGSIAVAGLSGGLVTLNSVGAITQVSGTISGSTVSLNTTGGASSTIGTASSKLNIDATTLAASTTNAEIGLNDIGGGVGVGTINAGSGDVTLTSVAGPITDFGGTITGGTVTLEIKSELDPSKSSDVASYVKRDIGTSGSPIKTSATNLSATTEYGAIYITETDAVTINNITAKFKGHAATLDASTGLVEAKAVDGTSDATGLNVALIAGGDITLGTASSTATLSAPLGLSITSTGKVLDGNGANNNITASSLSIAATQIGSPVNGATPADAIDIQSPMITSATASSGDIYLALSGKSTVQTITATSGDIGLSNAIGDLTLGGTITAGGNDVTIVNNTGKLLSSGSSVLANTVRLSARDGIGTSSAKIGTSATALITNVTTANALTYATSSNTLSSVTAVTKDGLVSIAGSGESSLSFAGGGGLLEATAGTTISFANTSGGMLLGAINAGSLGNVDLTSSGAMTGNVSTELTANAATLTASAIGTVSHLIEIPVTTLTATATAGGVFLHKNGVGAMTLTALAAGSGNDVTVTTGGDLILKSVTAPGVVTLTATGAMTDDNDVVSPAAINNNITASSAVLRASSIGEVANKIETTVATTLTATADTGGIYLTNSKAMTLTAAATTAAQTININNTGNLILNDVTASGGTVTLTSTGAMTDGNGASTNITALTTTLSATGIGTLANKIETAVSTLNATTTSSGIYITNTGALALTATAQGSGSDIDIDNGNSDISVGVVTAPGDAVTLTTTGNINDGNGATNNITARALTLNANTVDPDLGLSVSIISGSVSTPLTLTNTEPLALTASAISGGGTFTAPSITILDVDNTAPSDPTHVADVLTGSGLTNLATSANSLTLKTTTGHIVFLDTNDTISVTSPSGTIDIDAGYNPGDSGAVAIIGNLKTAGGAITVKADSHISIGELNSGITGDLVTVASRYGMIIDGNGPADNIIAGSASLSALTPSEYNAKIHTDQSISDAASAADKADTDTNTYNSTKANSGTYSLALTLANSAKDAATTDVNNARSAFNSADGTATQAELAAKILADLASALGIVADTAELVSSAAQIIPLVGDGGASVAYTALKWVANAANLGALISGETAKALRDTANDKEKTLTADQTILDNKVETADKALVDSNLWAETLSTYNKIMQQSLVTSAAAQLVKAQALTADHHISILTTDSGGYVHHSGYYEANAIGTSGNYLGIQVPGRVDISATDSNVYLKTTGTVELGTITASLNYVLGPSVVLVNGIGTGDVTVVGPVTATDLVRIDTLNGSILQGSDNGTTGLISAKNFIATAKVGVGNGSPLVTSVTNFAASGHNSGGVSIKNNKALNITSVIDNSLINEAAGTYGTAADSPVVGVTATGGTSDISTTAGLLTVQQAVDAGGGHIKLTGATGVTHEAAGDLTTTGTGTISVTAQANDITMADGTVYSTGSGQVDLLAATNVKLGEITTTSSAINITATAGSISDITAAVTELPNITTSGTVTLVAATGIGASGPSDIDTAIGTLAATNSTSGSIFVQETNELIIANAGVSTGGGNGNIVIDVVLGDLTVSSAVSANGSGNVLLNVLGSGASIASSANIQSGSGNISLLAAKDVTFTNNADVLTNGSGSTGTIDIEAGSGTIDLSTGSDQTAGSGAIRLNAGTDVKLGGTVTTDGNVSVKAGGSISDNDSDGSNDISAAGLRLNAGVGIGTGANPIETTVATVSARAQGGGIYLLEADALSVDDVGLSVNRVASNATTSTTDTTDAVQSDIRTTGGNGNIVLRTTNGKITLNDGTAADDDTAISANGTGNILVEAIGAGTDIEANADVITLNTAGTASGTGNISVLAAQSVSFTGTSDIRTSSTAGTDGSIDVLAGTGSITQSATSLFKTTGATGNVRLDAATNVVVGDIESADGKVSITATSGSITDADALVDSANDADQDITASGLRLNAGTFIGDSVNHLETTVGTLSARAGNGSIYLLEADALSVDDVGLSVNRVASNATTSTTDTTDAVQWI